jgi:hypothetical protein
MLGLVPLEHQLHPHSTLEKLGFLIMNIPNAHKPTAIVSFGAFGSLVVLRFIKNMFKGSWVYRLPEVLIVVVISTSACFPFHTTCG